MFMTVGLVYLPNASAQDGTSDESDTQEDVSDNSGAQDETSENSDAQDDMLNVPEYWVCDVEWYSDEICDCGCGDNDPVCPRGLFDICERSGCPEGQVPWEHAPSSCMRSACGDGWADEQMGEVCDDGEALDGGGCSRDCQMVNVGWTCGSNADGCESSVVKENDDDDDTNDLVLDADNDETNDSPDFNDSNANPDASVTTDSMVPVEVIEFDTTTQADNSGCSSARNSSTPYFLIGALLALVGMRRRLLSVIK